MKNTHSKKLLACFLAALGLSANSANVNVSASFKQFGSDLRFALNLGGEKAEERKKLDQLADKINDRCVGKIDEISDNKGKIKLDQIELSDIASELYENLCEIAEYRKRKKYNSKLYDSLTGNNNSLNLINEYPGNINGAKTRQWISNVYKSVNGGKLTVFQGKIKTALQNLTSWPNFMFNNNKDNDLFKAWSSIAYQQDLNQERPLESPVEKKVLNGVECYLDKAGNLSLKLAEKVNKIQNLFSLIPASTSKYVFYGCENLKEITIPSSVKIIYSLAFGFCSNLEKIKIPSSVKIISIAAFEGCDNLKTVEISEDSPIKDGIKKMLPKLLPKVKIQEFQEF